MFGSNHKKVFGKLIERRPESILNNINFAENGFFHSRFPAKFKKNVELLHRSRT